MATRRTNLLVTGALGHIGSAFIRRLRPDRYGEVRLVDNLASQRYVSLFDLPKAVRFSFVEDDIRTAPLEDLLVGTDVVVHLAAMTDAPASVENPEAVQAVNCEGTRRIVEACRARGCRLIFLSTTSVYGPHSARVDEACAESDLRPQSPYASSKLAAERLIEKAGADGGLDYVIFRFGTIFGTSVGMRFHTAVNKFVWLAVTGRPLTVWRTALHQRRPYLALDDAVRALDFVIRRNVVDGRVYNAVTVNATVADIVRQIRRRVPSTRIRYVDSPIMNQLSYRVSSRRFERLGFRFRGSLADGIAGTVKLFGGLARGRGGPRAGG
jgi:nucleoside-diphosphate-sugar epimerase